MVHPGDQHDGSARHQRVLILSDLNFEVAVLVGA